MRVLRRRRGWQQAELGRQAGLSRDVVHRAEIGKLLGIKVGSLERLVTALEAELVIEIRWRGVELDAVLDRRHAALVTAAADRLGRARWIASPEVSFNHNGDRGRCDLVAWHEPTRTLLIVEVKSRIGKIQETLGRLDVKVRLGGVIADELGLGRPGRAAFAWLRAPMGSASGLLWFESPDSVEGHRKQRFIALRHHGAG
jgi:transcriptional regulator with XRE-family HTH domain